MVDWFGDGYRWYVSGIIHDETGFPSTNSPENISSQIKRLHQKVDDNIADIEAYEEFMTEDAEVLVVAIGLVSRAAKDAIREIRAEGVKAGLFRPITLWPFPEQRLTALCKGKKKIMTCEMNEGQLYHVVKECKGDTAIRMVNQNNGVILSADTILEALREEK